MQVKRLVWFILLVWIRTKWGTTIFNSAHPHTLFRSPGSIRDWENKGLIAYYCCQQKSWVDWNAPHRALSLSCLVAKTTFPNAGSSWINILQADAESGMSGWPCGWCFPMPCPLLLQPPLKGMSHSSSGGMWQWIHNLTHCRFHRTLLVKHPPTPRKVKARCSFQRSPIWSGAPCRSCENGKHSSSLGGKEWAGSGSCTFWQCWMKLVLHPGCLQQLCWCGTAQGKQEEQQTEEESISGCCKMSTAASGFRGTAKVWLAPHHSKRTAEIQCFKQTIASLSQLMQEEKLWAKHGQKNEKAGTWKWIWMWLKG